MFEAVQLETSTFLFLLWFLFSTQWIHHDLPARS